jgi:hypothetical protein
MPLPFEIAEGRTGLQSAIGSAGGGGWTEDSPAHRSERRTRVPASLSFYCLVLYSRDSKLNRRVADYVEEHHQELDQLFGPRLHGFALGTPKGEKRRKRAAEIYDIARTFGLGADELPCAVLSTTLERPKKRLLVSFDGFMPPEKDRRRGDIAQAFRAVSGASDRCAGLPVRRRLAHLEKELRDARRNVYGERAASGNALQQIADDSEALSRIAKSGKTVAAVLAPVVAYVIGGAAR